MEKVLEQGSLGLGALPDSLYPIILYLLFYLFVALKRSGDDAA